MTKRPLAGNITKGRKINKWTQGIASRRVGAKLTTWQQWEYDNAEPGLKMIRNIMVAFDLKEEDMWPFIYNEKFWEQKPAL